jgi:hypothetical protein
MQKTIQHRPDPHKAAAHIQSLNGKWQNLIVVQIAHAKAPRQ